MAAATRTWHFTLWRISRKRKVFEKFICNFHKQVTKVFLLMKYEEI